MDNMCIGGFGFFFIVVYYFVNLLNFIGEVVVIGVGMNIGSN